MQRIGNAGILGDRAIVEIDAAGIAEEPYIFHQGARTNGLVDLGFFLLTQVNAFGVTAAFEIKHVIAAPAMLVVPDQAPAGIGAKSSFAGPAEAEENCGIAIGALISGAVHA